MMHSKYKYKRSRFYINEKMDIVLSSLLKAVFRRSFLNNLKTYSKLLMIKKN